MNAIEVSKVIGMFEINYKNFKVSNDEAALELWLRALKDLSYEECEEATLRIIMESDFAPTIATVRRAVRDMNPQIPTAGDAWGEVEQALIKFDMRQDKKAIDSLSPIAGQVVKNMGWWCLKNSNNQMADRAHFLKMYEEIAKKERQEQLMPPSLQVEQIENNRKPKELTEGEK